MHTQNGKAQVTQVSSAGRMQSPYLKDRGSLRHLLSASSSSMPASNHLLLSLLGFGFARGYTFGQSIINAGGSSLTSQPYLYNYHSDSLFHQFPNDINKPIIHSELGLTPQYHNLVYNYIKGFAGTETPQFVPNIQQPFAFNNFQSEFTPLQEGASVLNVNYPLDVTPSVVGQTNLNVQGGSTGFLETKPGTNDYFLPSDILSLANQPVPGNGLRRNFEIFKTEKLTAKARPTSLPPIGGVISDYVLRRNEPAVTGNLPGSEEYQQIKRELPDDSDSVVVEAEPLQNTKNQETPAEHKENDEEEMEEEMDEEEEEYQPAVAQSKPAAIALAGPGGVAQASPVATALVGHKGLAVSAPSGTAVAGTKTGGGPIQIGGEKQNKNKPEDSDSE